MSDALHQALSANRELVRQLAEVRKAGDALADMLDNPVRMDGGYHDYDSDTVENGLTAYRNATTTKEPTK